MSEKIECPKCEEYLDDCICGEKDDVLENDPEGLREQR